MNVGRHSHTVTTGSVTIPCSTMNRRNRQEIRNLTFDHIDLEDICQAFYPTVGEYYSITGIERFQK